MEAMDASTNNSTTTDEFDPDSPDCPDSSDRLDNNIYEADKEMSGTLQEFYGNDIVYRFDKRKRIVFGVVTESYEAASDVDDFDSLEKGQIRVWWVMSSRERIWKQDKVRLLNRSILPGDIVRRFIMGQDTQRGYCKSAKQLVTVQIVGTDKIIEKVCSSRLKPVSKFIFDKYVALDGKCGRIQNVYYKIFMQSKCGSSVEVTHITSSQATLDDYWLSKRNRWYSGAYYPGQEIVCIPQHFHNPNWIHRSKTMKRKMDCRMRFTIQSVEIESINVVWHTTSNFETGGLDKESIKEDDLKRVRILEGTDSHYLDLAERMFLKLSSSDKLLKKQVWQRKLSSFYKPDVHKVSSKHAFNRASRQFRRNSSISQNLAPAPTSDSEDWWTDEGAGSDNDSNSSTASLKKKKKKHWPPRSAEIVPGNTLPVEILCFESKITVVWQDGTTEEDIPSTQLYYSMSLDDHEFFPGEWVLGENQNGPEYGCVESVDHIERTAKVKWFRDLIDGSCCIYFHTSEVSVYDLQKHQKYQYRPGSTVYSTTVLDRMGYVLDSYPEGFVQVHWMDGVESNHIPQELILIPDADYDIVSDSTTELALESWETESVESIEEDNPNEENTLSLVASKLDFIRNKLLCLREIFKTYRTTENLMYMRDLLIMYDNSSYLDKLLGTSFFSRKSHHFKMILDQVRERAKSLGVELSGRLFNGTPLEPPPAVSIRTAEKKTLEKVQNIESSLNAEIVRPLCLESVKEASNENLCVEILSMLKARMDLAYAEIISRIGGQNALMVMTKASENTPVQTVANTPDEFIENIEIAIPEEETCCEGYIVLEDAPPTHHFYMTENFPTSQTFFKAIRKEVKSLKDCLPAGVWVRGYSNRIDLLSVMIKGPSKTPYEDGLFLFDIQLAADYPHSPPTVHYISYSSERINPNLYVEGKVCVSLLGTWVGRGTEVWGPSSSLLQLIVSIQGLILVSEPYYNEAGYEKQLDSQEGCENSRTYNELVILKLVQSMKVLLRSPPEVFQKEILTHFAQNGQRFCDRIEKWISNDPNSAPDFPLRPVSKGFLLSLQSALKSFKEVLEESKKIKFE